MKRFFLDIPTNGSGEIIDLSRRIHEHASDLAGTGLLHLFIGGSTAAITTVEFEPGLVKHDLPALFERLAPADGVYQHEQTWNDDNGHSHQLSSLFGAGLAIPFEKGKLLTGEWQQVVLVDFDTRPRKRRVVCSIIE
ncbi:MAG: secondary thiamine-phosphate synthase enzyme YjbQ [Tepidisphaeraceae bacterium]